MGRPRVVPSARPEISQTPRSATSPAAVMALGFGVLGWLVGASLTPLLLGHDHHDAYGAHYRHVDGSEATILAVASAAVLGAVAWAITLAVTSPVSAGAQASVPRRRTRWVAAAPPLLFVATQAPVTEASCALPLVAGTAIHAVLGAVALALARGCTETLSRRFGVPRLSPGAQRRPRELPLVVSAVGLHRLARAGLSCRAPPILPAL